MKAYIRTVFFGRDAQLFKNNVDLILNSIDYTTHTVTTHCQYTDADLIFCIVVTPK